MSDLVDDLHAAEDFGETIRVRARAVIDAFVETAKHDPTSANGAFAWGTFQVALRDLDSVTETQFERPGCEEIGPDDDDYDHEEGGGASMCIQGADCGGYHPWVLE